MEGGPPESASPVGLRQLPPGGFWAAIALLALLGAFLVLVVVHSFFGPNADVEVVPVAFGEREIHSGQSRGNPVGFVSGTQPTVATEGGEEFDLDTSAQDVVHLRGTYGCTAQGFAWLPLFQRRLEDCTEIEPPPISEAAKPTTPGEFIGCATTATFGFLAPETGDELVVELDGCFKGGLVANPGLYNCLLTSPVGDERTKATIRNCARIYIRRDGPGPLVFGGPP